VKFLKTILISCLTLISSQIIAQDFNNESSIETKIEFFPNPVTEVLNITIKGNLENTNFTLHNIIGNRIKIQPEKVSENQYKINVNGLASGYYLLMIRDERNAFSYTHKFLKR